MRSLIVVGPDGDARGGPPFDGDVANERRRLFSRYLVDKSVFPLY